MADDLDLSGRKVGHGHPCFIIAEAGVNHNGNLESALQLVDVAAEAGAEGIKFQLYRVEEQISWAAPPAEYQKARTGSDSMVEMARSYDLPWKAHRAIAAHCRQVGIRYMASCFDTQAVDLLLELGGDCIKVGSGELTNFPLLAYMASTAKPILLSTGMCTLEDVRGAVEQIRSHGDGPVVLLHCVSNYPADPAAVNMRAMQTMANTFGVLVGYSDHTLGSTVAATAVALGACIVEKHFTLDNTLPGPDHAASLEPEELRDFVAAIRTAESALGDGVKAPHPSELPTRIVARRSLVSARLILAGEELEDGNVTLKRPATGIDPRVWEKVRGRKAAVEIPGDIPITWEMLA